METFKDLLAGTVAGWAQVLVAQPFDILKVRLQTQDASNPKYRGAVDCFRQTLRQGPLEFYRGTLSPLLGVGVVVSIQFTALQVAQRAWLDAKRRAGDLSPTLALGEVFGCGAVAGLACSAVSSPVEHVRIRMQVQNVGAGTSYKGSVDAARQILSQHGLAGLYKGYTPTLARETLGFGCYFAFYEMAKRFLVQQGGSEADLGMWDYMGAGAFAGFCMWIPSYPADVMKSRFQAMPFDQTPSLRAATKALLAKEGLRGLFAGFGPCMVRAAPVNGVTFLVYEVVKQRLDAALPTAEHDHWQGQT